MKQVYVCFFSSLIIILYSCKESLSKKNTSDCIVIEEGECLTAKELAFASNYTNKQDSEMIVKKYIEKWKANLTLYKKAQKEVTVDEEELNAYITELKRQYYISAYIKKYIDENLDTTILNKEIIEYYQKNKENFKLSSNIVQLFYVKLNDDERDIAEYKKLLSGKDKQKLFSFISEKSNGYFIEDSLWLKWEDLTREVGFLKNYEVQRIPKGKIIEWRDGTYYYYIKIKDYKTKDEYSPIIYEKEKIKRIILEDRKRELVEKLYKEEIFRERK
ncbi:MAG: hypothetical protein KatS3mg027_0691 [Bacteroidia bacterium]|nr:MAG: hypothetical protein KatS3mg027_0691 [Bacteroidia bacterium]